MEIFSWWKGALLHSLIQSNQRLPRSPAANWAQPGWCSSENPKARVTDCSIPGKWDPALPVCLWGGVPSFFHAVVWQQRDEDWAHYYELLIGKIYPNYFKGLSYFHLCTWGFPSMYIHLCIVATVILWDFGIKQKGCGSTGRGVRVKYVSSLFLLTACWLPCAIPGNLEVGVHIADVSYFVLEETALDKVASERATSVYLVQKVRTAFPLSVW